MSVCPRKLQCFMFSCLETILFKFKDCGFLDISCIGDENDFYCYFNKPHILIGYV